MTLFLGLALLFGVGTAILIYALPVLLVIGFWAIVGLAGFGALAAAVTHWEQIATAVFVPPMGLMMLAMAAVGMDWQHSPVPRDFREALPFFAYVVVFYAAVGWFWWWAGTATKRRQAQLRRQGAI